MGSFGSGLEPAPRRLVESSQRLGAPRHAGLAREAVRVVVDGVPQTIEVVRQERHLGGTQGYWLCPKCAALRSHLFILDGSLCCRVCGKISYRSQHVLHPAVTRAAKLRRKLGGAPGLLSPIPRKPRHWSPVYYRRLVAELIATERVLRDMLGGTIRALERRNGRLHRGRQR
jgi:hypothetical protein